MQAILHRILTFYQTIDQNTCRHLWRGLWPIGRWGFVAAVLTSLVLALGLSLGWGMQGAIALPSPRNSNDAASPFQAGVAAFQQGNAPQALIHFTEAVRQNPTQASAYGNRCLTYLTLDNPQQAIGDCAQAVQLNPKNLEALLNQGLAAAQLGELEAAIAIYDRLIQARPADYRAYYNRGLAHVETGDLRDAIVDFSEAARQVLPSDRRTKAIAYNERGLVHLQLENHRSAIADFSEAIQFSADNPEYFYNRGCVYHQIGSLEDAQINFTRALSDRPDYAEAYASRGLVYKDLHQPDAALADLEQAAQLFSDQGNLTAYQQTLSLVQRIRNPSVAVS
jgi:tetratricopeptide (TPR) repeat protein